MKKVLVSLCIMYSLVFSVSFLPAAEEKRYDVPIGDSPSIGPENAPVTIIEFLDYQ